MCQGTKHQKRKVETKRTKKGEKVTILKLTLLFGKFVFDHFRRASKLWQKN